MCNVSPDISFLTSIIETSKGLYMHQLYSVKSGKHQEWLLKSETDIMSVNRVIAFVILYEKV